MANNLVHPSWMTENFFEPILQKSENDRNLKVTSFEVTPASKVGENFASVIFRIKLSFITNNQEKSKLLILKTKPEAEGYLKDMLDQTPIFDIEMKVYSKCVPEMERLLSYVGDKTQFGAKLIYCSREPHDVLIFEDLCDQGYAVPEKRYLSFEGSIILFKKVAKWHACSYYMSKNDFVDLTEFNICLFNGTLGDGACEFVRSNLIPAKKALMTCPDMVKHEAKIDKYIDNLKERGTAIFAPYPGKDEYNVLNHGDLHAKNLMLKEEDGKIVDILLIDYQIANFGSPALDLGYAMHNIFDEETRTNHRDEIIHIYYTEFVETLKRLGFLGRIPTMIELQIELLRKGGFVEVYTALAFLPFREVDFTKIPPENLTNPEKMVVFKESLFQLPEILKMLKKSCLEFIRKGFL